MMIYDPYANQTITIVQSVIEIIARIGFEVKHWTQHRYRAFTQRPIPDGPFVNCD